MHSQFFGLFLAIFALCWLLREHLPFFGHLPGDLHITGRTFSLTIPLMSCLVISLLVSLIARLMAHK